MKKNIVFTYQIKNDALDTFTDVILAFFKNSSLCSSKISKSSSAASQQEKTAFITAYIITLSIIIRTYHFNGMDFFVYGVGLSNAIF